MIEIIWINDTASTAIYTLSLHDALPIFKSQALISGIGPFLFPRDKNPSGHHKNLKTAWRKTLKRAGDRKSTRLNSSHTVTSYAVFCLKKKKTSWELRHNATEDGEQELNL